MARAHLWRPTARLRRAPPGTGGAARGSLVLGHGAGGGIEAPDLQGLTALTRDGWQVVLVEQPWRVAGRRVATPPPTLDVGWLAVLSELWLSGALSDRLVVGGRSAGARVACRTAMAMPVRPVGVLALAFPLHPPGNPARSRAPEALAVGAARIRLAVVQGERDPFGTPAQVAEALGARLAAPLDALATGRSRARAEMFAPRVLAAAGAHGFTPASGDVVDLVRGWLRVLPR